jgi:putative heme-binding domain-containing protein
MLADGNEGRAALSPARRRGPLAKAGTPYLVLAFALMFLASGFALAAEPNMVAIEALQRLKGMDLEANPAIKSAVLKVLETTRGLPQFVEIVRDFNIKGQSAELLAFAASNPTNSLGIDALRLAVAESGTAALTNSPGLIEAMGNSADKQFVLFLSAALDDGKSPVETRKAAVKALAQTEEGSAHILKLAGEDKLDPALKFTASAALNSARWPQIQSEAAKLLPLPQGQNAALPPVTELVKMKGDPANGAKVFRRPEVNCVSCHRINGEGADFGPDLSEIGTKLAREAIYEAILDPSAGIAFGYEAWQLVLKNGEEPFGLITSETADEITVKTQNGISTPYKKSDIAKQTKMKLSIMPQGLQMAMKTQDLVDLVEYLSGQKKKSP